MQFRLTKHAHERYRHRFGDGHPKFTLQQLVDNSEEAKGKSRKYAWIYEGQTLRISVDLPNLGFVIDLRTRKVLTVLNVNEIMAVAGCFPKKKKNGNRSRRDRIRRNERISENALYSA